MVITLATHCTINGRKLGYGQPTYIVAELSANHNQDFDRAVQLVKAAKDAGADAVKLQTYKPETMTIDSSDEKFQARGARWKGMSLYEVYQQAYTPWEWHADLKELANGLGLDFFSSPFDATAVDFLEGLDVPAYKIASFEIVDIPLIEKAASTGKSLIISTGMATLGEIEEAVSTARNAGAENVILLKCTSAYPAPPDQSHLATIAHMADAFSVPVGLSDHTLGIGVPIGAVALGACMVEKHFTITHDDSSPDQEFSLDPAEFRAMVEGIRQVEGAVGSINYGGTEDEARSRRRSLYVVEDVREGDELTNANLKSLRPGSGLPPKFLDQVVGRKANRDIPKGTPLRWNLINFSVVGGTF